MFRSIAVGHHSCLDSHDKKRIWRRPCVAVLLAVALVAGIPSSPTLATDLDWLEEQTKKLLDDIYEGTKEAVTGESAQPPEEDDPAPEVQVQDTPAATPNPPKIEQSTPQVQVADTPRFDKPWVTEIQTHLTTLGYNPGAIDGAFGNKSQLAITAFQQHRGDPVTGLPTPSVMAALRSESQAETAAAAPAATEQPAADPSANTPSSPIKTIDKAELDKAAFPLAAYTPNNLAHSDAVITVCGGTRDPMLRENAVAMIEVWRGDNSEGTVQNYDKIFDIFVNGFTKTGRCFDREKNTTTAADAYTEYQRYQTRVLELSAELRIAEVDTASAEPVAESAPTPPVAHPVPWTQVCLTRRA